MLGAIFILRKDIGVGGGPENDNFSLLYVAKMSLPRWVGGSKKPQNTLTEYKNGPLHRFGALCYPCHVLLTFLGSSLYSAFGIDITVFQQWVCTISILVTMKMQTFVKN
jgi:hypothetical protein